MGVGMREIAFDESSGTLYGTDYTTLYTIPIVPIPGPPYAVSGPPQPVGAHGNRPDQTPFDEVWSLDYDPSIDQLVGTSWRADDGATDLCYFDRGTGAATLVADTGQDRITDIWYSHSSGTMFGVGNGPGRVYSINTTTGTATELGETGPGDPSVLGMANLFPASPLPPAIDPPGDMEPAPLSLLGYETMVNVNVEAVVEVEYFNPPDFMSDWQDDFGSDFNINTQASAFANVEASVDAAWQATDAYGDIDAQLLGDNIAIFASMGAEAMGDDGGIPDTAVFRQSMMMGDAQIFGQFQVGVPDGGIPGLPGELTINLNLNEGGLHLMGWGLTIYDPDADETLLELGDGDGGGVWTIDVTAGQILEFDFGFGVEMFEMDGFWDLGFDLGFAAEAEVPEPTSAILLAFGALAVLRRRRRK